MNGIAEIIDHHKLLVFAGFLLIVSILVVCAIMVDFIDGVHTAKSTGERVHSHKFRVTIGKVSEYWRFLLIGFLIDCVGCLFDFYLIPYVVIAFGTGLMLIEVKSMFEHARRRKSSTQSLEKILRRMVNVSTKEEARELLGKILESTAEEGNSTTETLNTEQ